MLNVFYQLHIFVEWVYAFEQYSTRGLTSVLYELNRLFVYYCSSYHT